MRPACALTCYVYFAALRRDTSRFTLRRSHPSDARARLRCALTLAIRCLELCVDDSIPSCQTYAVGVPLRHRTTSAHSPPSLALQCRRPKRSGNVRHVYAAEEVLAASARNLPLGCPRAVGLAPAHMVGQSVCNSRLPKRGRSQPHTPAERLFDGCALSTQKEPSLCTNRRIGSPRIPWSVAGRPRPSKMRTGQASTR